ncbi:DNA polymerase III subunit gamma and tau [Streptomyces sp. KL110A]|uniref:DNA polymerase III subunit gamma and tau n=1 Tax=Streptomyces sp. KL110A TaxID=3384221 RepID=UPI0038C69D01
MSSLALYRRYRPESFAEVIGQEHVTDPLQQALRNNRVNHAYLFSGPRGCGKTTSARILARCLNCEQGPTPTPCGECQSCRDLARNGPGSIDVIEIDAASHGGVDDARDLREKAFFGPASSRYKIYIIDEAHMVTPAGFNALLKVVEEPPEHLKFIFATTEPEKVIGTIRSRTHHYPFRLVPPGTLREYLGDVCGREGIPVDEGVLPLVVRAGAGSVRDSMSVMDQLLAGAGEAGVTYAMATSLLGYTDSSLLDSVVDAFASGDGAAAFEVVDRIIEGGNDPRRFVADLLERLRDLVILAAVPDAAEKGLIDAPADVVERMQAQASVFGAAELSRAADLVNEGLTEMRGATSPRLQLELICARVLLPAAFDDERSLLARLDRLERGAAAAPPAAAVFTPAPPAGPPMGYVPAPRPTAARPAAPARRRPRAGAAQPQQPPQPAPQAQPDARAPRCLARRGPPRRLADRRARVRSRTAAGTGPGSAAGAARRAGSGRGHGGRRRPGAEHVAVHPRSGQEPAPLHLDPAESERAGGRLRRHHPPARLPQRRRAGQLREQRQRGRPQGRARRAVQRAVEGRGDHRPVGRLRAPARRRELLRGRRLRRRGRRPASSPARTGPAPAPCRAPAPAQAPPVAQAAPAPAPAPEQQRPPRPQPVAPEDDVPEEDDPDLVESALSGHELIVRELGATVVEEYTND